MKKIISLLCALSLICSFSYAYAYDEQSLTAAKALYDLGLLKGNSTAFSAESMDLDNYATRAQVAVTITRMLGNDEKARYQKKPSSLLRCP